MGATTDSSGAKSDSVEPQRRQQRGLVITQGDPAGIGPELILRAAAEGLLRAGDRIVLARDHLAHACAALEAAGVGAWVQAGREQLTALLDAQLPADAGQYAALVRGVDLVLEPGGRALVTAPIDKAVAASEGLTTPGHTEYLAARAGVSDFAMAMLGEQIRLTLATIHLPLSAVPQALTGEAVTRAARLLALALRDDFGLSAPKIVVCGLNPHAGEGGLLGHEDAQVIAPAIATLNQTLTWASFEGPTPADAAFPLQAQGRFDGVVAMYHDQGLAPFKLLHFSDGVNMTLGLPFVRTSPDHGTAKDIAGRGLADPASFFAAIRIARGGGRGQA